MGVYYPQSAMSLRVRWEDFGDKQSEALQKTYSLPILARRINVHINDYTQADTFDAEIDYKQFPFDPRCIRAIAVTIHAQNMEAVFLQNNALKQIIPSRENTIFMGFADDESIRFDDEKRTIRLEGRDFTSLLIDKKYPKGTIPLDQRLDVVLRGILSELRETQAIQLDNRVGGELPVIASFWGDKSEGSGKKNVKRDESYWDVIQDIVGRAGLIAYIELDKLVLSRPRVLYNKSATKVFVYGFNVKNLEFKRKIGRRKNFNIVVRSLNVESKEVLEAKIPLEATNEWSDATGIANQEVKVQELDKDGKPVAEADAKPAPYISFKIPNVANKEKLIEIGEAIYEEIGRQQIEGSFSTKEMEIRFNKLDVDGIQTPTIEDFNILSLRNGTPLAIVIDAGDLKDISRISNVGERKKFLLQRGYEEAVAQVFAETLGKYSNIFYTRSVRFMMDSEQGFSTDIEFVNFIETSSKFAGAL